MNILCVGVKPERSCCAYHTLTSAADKPLNVIQIKALRICLGTLQSTPNIVTIAESNETPLALQRLQRLTLCKQNPTCIESCCT